LRIKTYHRNAKATSNIFLENIEANKISEQTIEIKFLTKKNKKIILKIKTYTFSDVGDFIWMYFCHQKGLDLINGSKSTKNRIKIIWR